MEPGRKALLFSDWQIPQRIDSEYVAPIEVRPATLLPPVADIDRGTRGGSGECASRGRSNGIDRLIVNGLSIRVGKAGLQAVAEPLSHRCLTAVIVRVSSRINIRDRCELLICPDLRCQRALFDTTCKVARGVLIEIGLRCRAIHKRAIDDSGGNKGHSDTIGAACSSWRTTIAKILLHDQERRQNRIGVDLIQIIRAQEPCSAAPDVAYLSDYPSGQLMFDRQVPLMDRREFEFLIEHRQIRSIAERLLWRG